MCCLAPLLLLRPLPESVDTKERKNPPNKSRVSWLTSTSEVILNGRTQGGGPRVSLFDVFEVQTAIRVTRPSVRTKDWPTVLKDQSPKKAILNL